MYKLSAKLSDDLTWLGEAPKSVTYLLSLRSNDAQALSHLVEQWLFQERDEDGIVGDASIFRQGEGEGEGFPYAWAIVDEHEMQVVAILWIDEEDNND